MSADSDEKMVDVDPARVAQIVVALIRTELSATIATAVDQAIRKARGRVD